MLDICIFLKALFWNIIIWRWFDSSTSKESTCNAGDASSILGQEDPLEKEMATHSSILAWKIQWTEEPNGLQSKETQRVGHNCEWLNTFNPVRSFFYNLLGWEVKASYYLLLRQGLREDLLQWPELGVTPFWLVGRHPVPAVGPCLSRAGPVSTESVMRTLCRPPGLFAQLSLVLWPLVDLLRSDLQLSAFSAGSRLPQQALPHLPAQGLMPLCRPEAGAFISLTDSHIFLVSQVSLPFVF